MYVAQRVPAHQQTNVIAFPIGVVLIVASFCSAMEEIKLIHWYVTAVDSVTTQRIVLVTQDFPELIVNSQCVMENVTMTPLFAIVVEPVRLQMRVHALFLAGVVRIAKLQNVTQNLQQIQQFAMRKELVLVLTHVHANLVIWALNVSLGSVLAMIAHQQLFVQVMESVLDLIHALAFQDTLVYVVMITIALEFQSTLQPFAQAEEIVLILMFALVDLDLLESDAKLLQTREHPCIISFSWQSFQLVSLLEEL
jgi:hypothetical protein